MKSLNTVAVMVALAIATIPEASSHSVKDLEAMLGSREKYFQPIDKPAPHFELQDADGRVVDLAALRGKVVVVHFIYAGCPDICPLHADRIADVQAMVNQSPMKDVVRFVSITTDPKNDTPDVLRAYGGIHGLDAANWLFLTTTPNQPEDTTRKLAEQFGHKFQKTENEYQIHGIVTHVIDKDGRWRANFHGLKFEPANLVVFINALVNDDHKPHGHDERGMWDRLKRLFGS
ncbi:MAG: SCO family protein [Rhizobiales bacterium]|nr:SCO family protein [Hyphomicrobiales bacterium]